MLYLSKQLTDWGYHELSVLFHVICWKLLTNQSIFYVDAFYSMIQPLRYLLINKHMAVENSCCRLCITKGTWVQSLWILIYMIVESSVLFWMLCTLEFTLLYLWWDNYRKPDNFLWSLITRDIRVYRNF